MTDWKAAMSTVVRHVKMREAEATHRWAVIGSAATALHGVRVVPRDIDLLAEDPEGVAWLADAMQPFAPVRCPGPANDEAWFSSREQPLSVGPDDYGFHWTFGRWIVDKVKVEVAHIAAPKAWPTSTDGEGIWEAGFEIWPFIRVVSFRGHAVPVVPLEIQLETSARRGLDERVDGILEVLRRDGYDAALLRIALRKQRWEAFQHRLSVEGASGS